MSFRTGVALAALSIAALGCARGPTVPTASSPSLYQSPAPPPSPTIDDVGRARGLPPGAHVDVETLDHDAFLRAVRQEEKATEWSAHLADLFLSTLSMAKPSSGAGAAAQRSYDESLAGFYDPTAKKLFLRKDAIEKPSMTAITLAHEEEHALQDRFFGIPDFAKMSNADEMLAAKALFEGDATLTATMMHLHQTGASNVVSLAALARLSDADYARAASKTSPHEEIPDMSRATTTWPYQRGTTFAAQLAESGGWALLDAALQSPPQTTEQVLHVEKYVAGERAIDVRAPEAPDGYMSVERGRMGELQTRYFLAECVDAHLAEEAATGWGGDAFLIATQGSRSALLWSTAWDDAAAAARFSDALAARKGCPGGEKPPFVALRDGTRIAFVQGLDDDETRTREARKLLALVGRAPPSIPPVGDVKLALRPPVPADFMHRGRVEHGRFVDAPIGLSSDLGAMKLLKDDGYELLASDGSARVALAFRWSPPSDVLREAFVASLVDALRKVYPLARVFDLGTSRVAVASANVDARTIRVEDKRTVRLTLLPACEGRMTFALVTSWPPASANGEASTDAWLRSLRASDSSPACEALKTLRDPSDASTAPYGSR